MSSLSALVQTLRQHGTAGVLLCLYPHEHIPVLDALGPLLRGRVVRVVSQVVWYSDRMVLGWLGYRPAVSTQALQAWLPGREKGEGRNGSHPLAGFMDALMQQGAVTAPVNVRIGVMSRAQTARLVRDIRKEALRRLPGTVSARQWFILCCLAEGMKGGEVASLTGLNEKTVSLYRRHALAALGMETVVRGMPLYRGVLVREVLQRYPVAGSAESISPKCSVQDATLSI
ncbi:hypothetical protein LLH66_004682 [Salmonella enterica]|nr:hypothetical protein [Salmonella enterica]EDL3530272.1 hypothetical protein [Salmonella enterica subsp. enterica serovar Newport]EIL1872287.1 hypothetical protein [Salmonella enterica]EIO4275395.1 hypothetical protein [Salmonella enterica subsp. enterica serovar Newport]